MTSDTPPSSLLLIENGANAKVASVQGLTPLMHLAWHAEARDAVPLARLFLQHSAEIDAQGGEKRWSALMHAPFHGRESLVEFLTRARCVDDADRHRGEIGP